MHFFHTEQKGENMNLFKKYKNLYWPKPSYLIIGKNLSEDKSASWIELFLDLSFVIAIAILSQLLITSTDLISILGFSSGFTLLFIVWRSSTFYNQSFYTNTLRNRMVVFGHILCALMLVVFTETSERFFSGAHFYDAALPYMITTIVVNAYLGYIWWSAWRHLFNVTGQNDTYSIRALYWGVVNGTVSILLFILTLFHLFFHTSTSASVLIYTFFPIVLLQLLSPLGQRKICNKILQKSAEKRGTKSVYTTDHVDAGHTIERFGLFILLIIGEMFLGIVNAIKQVGVMKFETFIIFLLLLFVVAGIFWIYFDQVLSNKFKESRIAEWTIIQFFIALNLLYLASFNREIILDFQRYFYYIHSSYTVFFILLIIITFVIDSTEAGWLRGKGVDLSERMPIMKYLRIITILIFGCVYFFPFNNALLYTLFIVSIFILHAVIGMYIYLKSYDLKQK